MNHFELNIITPTEVISTEVEWLEVDTPTGSFLVCAGHSPLISIVKTKSTLSYKIPNTQPVVYPISSGIVQVMPTKTTIILDT